MIFVEIRRNISPKTTPMPVPHLPTHKPKHWHPYGQSGVSASQCITPYINDLRPLKEDEFSFPISYGRRLDREPNVFLQWGLIHVEKSIKDFDKYLVAENLNLPKGNPSRQVDNPYGYCSIGFRPHYNSIDIKTAIENGGQFQFDKSSYYGCQFDLRNPNNDGIRKDILKTFGLNPTGSYEDNRELTKTIRTTDLLKRLEKE